MISGRREQRASPIRIRGWPWIFIGTTLTTFGAGSINLLLPPVLVARGMTEATIGIVVAFGGIAAVATRVPAGASYRRSRIVAVMIAASAAMMFAALVIAGAHRTLPTAALSALHGAAFAGMSTVTMAAVVDARPPTVPLPSMMGWFTGSIGAGYSVAAFAAGALGNALGPRTALRLSSILPLLAGLCLTVGLTRVLDTRRVPRPRERHRDRLASIRHLPSGLVTAFVVGFAINYVTGALNAFFPLYALSIGLSLSQVGVIGGIHGTLASVVRFGADAVLARTALRRVTATLILAIAVAVTTLGFATGVIALGAIFAVLGISRGVLRVASGALAVEGSTASNHGSASGIYLSGLDLGNILGPIVGGFAAQAFGLRMAFPLIGMSLAVAYLAGVGASHVRRRGSPTA